jgi:hypothetical protein
MDVAVVSIDHLLIDDELERKFFFRFVSGRFN